MVHNLMAFSRVLVEYSEVSSGLTACSASLGSVSSMKASNSLRLELYSFDRVGNDLIGESTTWTTDQPAQLGAKLSGNGVAMNREGAASSESL